MDAAVSPWLATRLVTTGMSVFVFLPRTAMWACSSLHNQCHRFEVGEAGQEQSFSWMSYSIFPPLVPWMIAMHAVNEPESHWLSAWCHSEPGTKILLHHSCIHLSSLISPMSHWESVLVWNSVTQSGYTGLRLGHRTLLLHCVPRLGAPFSPLDNLINCILLHATKDEPHQSRCSVSCQFQGDLSKFP